MILALLKSISRDCCMKCYLDNPPFNFFALLPLWRFIRPLLHRYEPYISMHTTERHMAMVERSVKRLFPYLQELLRPKYALMK